MLTARHSGNICHYFRNDQYEAYGTIDDPRDPVPRGAPLAGTRTIECSPFPEDQGRVFYFGGYDVAGIRGAEHNTAWIYKGTLQSANKEKP
jgi:hypothetical protein